MAWLIVALVLQLAGFAGVVHFGGWGLALSLTALMTGARMGQMGVK